VVGEAAFVGRADELGLLEASLTAAQSGQAQIILVEGEPGIGKTALLRQCVNAAPDMTVIWASGDPAEWPTSG
jgi:Cdc6-like AAA superfamily ATPase